jgi:hypothetical protein
MDVLHKPYCIDLELAIASVAYSMEVGIAPTSSSFGAEHSQATGRHAQAAR